MSLRQTSTYVVFLLSKQTRRWTLQPPQRRERRRDIVISRNSRVTVVTVTVNFGLFVLCFFWLLVEGHLMHSMHSWFILCAVSLLLQMLANSFLHAGAGGLQSPALQPAEGMVRRDRSRTEWVTTCTVHGAQCTVVFAVAAHFVHCCTTTVQLSLRIWLTGRKSIEFRAASEYWEKRVAGATHVGFAKGCNSHACSSLMLVYSLLGS